MHLGVPNADYAYHELAFRITALGVVVRGLVTKDTALKRINVQGELLAAVAHAVCHLVDDSRRHRGG